MGVHSITYSLMPLGGLMAGAIATLTSAPIAIAVMATGLIVIVLWVGLSQPVISRLDGNSMPEGH